MKTGVAFIPVGVKHKDLSSICDWDSEPAVSIMQSQIKAFGQTTSNYIMTDFSVCASGWLPDEDVSKES